MMILQKLKTLLNIILIVSLFAVCATLLVNRAFSKGVSSSFDFRKIKNSDEASLVFWNWLLGYLKLSAQNASVHNIYQQDSAGFFYDLNDDGQREILGTHFATDISGRGSCYLYILAHDYDKAVKYHLISDDLTFDISKPIVVLNEKKDGYHIIQAGSQRTDRKKYFVFSKENNMYFEKFSFDKKLSD